VSGRFQRQADQQPSEGRGPSAPTCTCTSLRQAVPPVAVRCSLAVGSLPFSRLVRQRQSIRPVYTVYDVARTRSHGAISE
jgi:hypothetical protein